MADYFSRVDYDIPFISVSIHEEVMYILANATF